MTPGAALRSHSGQFGAENRLTCRVHYLASSFSLRCRFRRMAHVGLNPSGFDYNFGSWLLLWIEHVEALSASEPRPEL